MVRDSDEKAKLSQEEDEGSANERQNFQLN